MSGEYIETLIWHQITFRDNLFEAVYLIAAASFRICHHADRRLVDCRLVKGAFKYAMRLQSTDTRNAKTKTE